MNNNFLVKQKLKTKKDEKDFFEIHDTTIGDFTLMTPRFKLIVLRNKHKLSIYAFKFEEILFFARLTEQKKILLDANSLNFCLMRR